MSNPTLEAADLNEIFERDPLEYTDQDLEIIIAAMRDKRYRFNQGDLKAGTVKHKTPKALEGVDEEALKGLELKL